MSLYGCSFTTIALCCNCSKIRIFLTTSIVNLSSFLVGRANYQAKSRWTETTAWERRRQRFLSLRNRQLPGNKHLNCSKAREKYMTFAVIFRAKAKGRESLYCLVCNGQAMSKARENNYSVQSVAHLSLEWFPEFTPLFFIPEFTQGVCNESFAFIEIVIW